MKKTAVLALTMIWLTLPGFSQKENGFKSFNKNLPGTTVHGLSFKNISGSYNLKSAVGYTKLPLSEKFIIQDLIMEGRIKNLIRVSGSPVYFEREKKNLKSGQSIPVEEQFYAFFNDTKSITKLTDPWEELKILKVTTDEFGIVHIKAQQVFHGIEIYGAESFLHIASDRDIFTGRVISVRPQFSIIPQIGSENAIAVVRSDVGTRTSLKKLSSSEKSFLGYDSPEAQLIIYEGKLAYKISIRPNFIEEWKYFIDAENGGILFSYNNTYSDGPATANAIDLNGISRTVNTYLENSTYLLIDASEQMYNSATGEGIIMTLDAKNTSAVKLDYDYITSVNNTWNIPAGISAHFNAKKTYEYLQSTFNRNSLNNQGGNIISFINVTEEDGSSMENAFWNGKAVFYGNGGSAFKPLAGALDVAAHELGHGVISNTANLEYNDQSGAINESYADIFGSMVDREDWYIGEDVTRTSFSPSGRLRDMSDPHNRGTLNDPYWQPASVSEMYLGSQDNGGVHINSGIVNHAYYLFATATSKEKAEQVFYKALTNYLTSKSQFIDLRIAIVQSATDMYGEASNEVTAVKNAFDAVGIYDDSTTNPEQDIPVNPGQDYLLFYNTLTPETYGTLYRSSTNGETFDRLSSTYMKRGASVSDDGTYALFVSDASLITALYTDPLDPQEAPLSNEAFWDNVAISKDGNRVAAISTEIDTSIYIFDYITQEWSVFKLYNPTTSEDGNNAGGVIYADAIEFDNTGEYLIYDAYNELYSSTGDDISYWDIGFIKVWDNTANYFGDGTIQKLYGSLPESVSIGNPTFSKNSPYIIAFDYYNSATEEYGIFGLNLVTGDLDVITPNNTIGYPSFSRDDDKVAFNTSDGGYDAVGVVSLDTNKITGISYSTILIADAKWPVFYAEGKRNLELPPVANFTVDIKSGGAPLSVQFLDLSTNKPVSWNWSFPGGDPATSSLQNPVVVYNTSGIYQVALTCSNNSGNDAMTKTNYINVYHTGTESRVEELIKYYPNPTDGMLYIDSDRDFRVNITDLTGKVLINSQNQKDINLQEWKPGIYIMKLETSGKIITDKIIRR